MKWLPEALAVQLRWMRDEPLVRALLVERVEAAHPDWVARFEELRRHGRLPLTRLLELGARQGSVRDDIDADVLAALIQELQVHPLVMHGTPTEPDSPRWAAALSLIVAGLQVTK